MQIIYCSAGVQEREFHSRESNEVSSNKTNEVSTSKPASSFASNLRNIKCKLPDEAKM